MHRYRRPLSVVRGDTADNLRVVSLSVLKRTYELSVDPATGGTQWSKLINVCLWSTNAERKEAMQHARPGGRRRASWGKELSFLVKKPRTYGCASVPTSLVGLEPHWQRK